uniref:PARP catalytic domain-containing protein n=1 Tax=Nelumbo nucifera TaxID=4432 RepID=A0A822Z4X0_NELNU|nr:TPA_asm: hypothetical protein HUJ06_014200 [Nelumbo nucifera]
MKKSNYQTRFSCGVVLEVLIYSGTCIKGSYLPVPGYMFGKAIICSDAAAEAARYGFTSVDRPEGSLPGLSHCFLGRQSDRVKEPTRGIQGSCNSFALIISSGILHMQDTKK